MSDGSLVSKDLIIIATLFGISLAGNQIPPISCTDFVSFVAKEMNLFESFIFDVPQCIRLVPSFWKDVEGNFPSDGIRESVVWELFLQRIDKCYT
jgi:hypothetical protein